jgi:peptidoglycan/LPS O-acetylase OafA/YrhL
MLKQQEYFDQLDGLRCFAVLLTMMAHWFPALGYPIIPYCWKGVDLFFMISGFLITLILLKKKETVTDKLLIVKNFSIRRVLRIFPIYYLFIGFFFITYLLFHAKWWVPDLGPYLFTYTSNIYYMLGGHGNGIFEHTWSLAIEEQFYLIWPWIICFISRRFLMPVIAVFILIGAASNIFPNAVFIIKLLPVRNFDTLCAGAIFAYLYFYCKNSLLFNKLFQYRKILFVVFSVVFIILYNCFNYPKYFSYAEEFILLPIGFLIVVNTILGWGSITKWILKSKPVKYIGKISYGIYLFHMPVPALFRLFISKTHFASVHIPGLLLLCIFFTITLILATVSFKFLETRILRLKVYFN